jgi:hypothetical protein
MALIFAVNTAQFPDGRRVFFGNDVYIDNLEFEAIPEPASMGSGVRGRCVVARLAEKRIFVAVSFS